MSHPLEGVRAKLARGEKHLKALDAELDRIFTKRKRPPGFAARQEFYPEHETMRVVVTEVGELPQKLGTLVGDTAHNFRSALDQLVYELAFIDNGGSEAGLDKTAFPASRSIENFRGGYVQTKMLAGLTKTHRAMFRRFQPYQVAEKVRNLHPLAYLDDLSNDDKHRLLQPLLIAPAGVTISFPKSLQGNDCNFANDRAHFIAHNILGQPLEPDTELFRAHVVVTGPKPDMPMQISAKMNVGFRDGVPATNVLTAIADIVRRAIDTFAPEFEKRTALRYRSVPRLGRWADRPPVIFPMKTNIESGGIPIPFTQGPGPEIAVHGRASPSKG